MNSELITNKFSKEFSNYLNKSGINPNIYNIPLNFRFIRLHSKCLNLYSDSEELEWKNINLEKIRQLTSWKFIEYISQSNGFFKIGMDEKIQSTKLYEDGLVYGIDLSSGIAVEALNVQPDDHVLDICCAPGAKLLMTADLLFNGTGTVTGVDISSPRLSNTRSLIKKYKLLHKVRLFCQDATKFDVLIPTELKKASKSTVEGAKPFYAPKLLRYNLQYLENNTSSNDNNLYDKIIVDAECTHDGSIHHILKYFNNNTPNNFNSNLNWNEFESKFLNIDYLNSLYDLQLSLLKRGYQLLKPGGTLIYSTCSLSQHQNERIILKFYQGLEQAQETLPQWQSVQDTVDIGLTFGPANLKGLSEEYSDIELDRLKGAVRMDPEISQTSGLFIFKLTKPIVNDDENNMNKRQKI